MALLRQHAVLISLSLTALMLGCCGASGPQTLTTSDGLAQITVTNGMTKTVLMDHPDATLQVGNIFREIYALVISESKAEPLLAGYDLDSYTKLMHDGNLENLTQASSTPIETSTINGHPARRWTVTGKADGVDIYFVFAAIDAGGHYNQVMTWTLKDRKDKYEQTLVDVVESFKLAK